MKRKLLQVLQVLLYNNKLTFEVSEDISKPVFQTKRRRKKKQFEVLNLQVIIWYLRILT